MAVSGLGFVLATYCLARQVLGADKRTGLAAGLVLGVGMHTYIPMRMVPPLLVLLALIKLLLDCITVSDQHDTQCLVGLQRRQVVHHVAAAAQGVVLPGDRDNWYGGLRGDPVHIASAPQ